MPICIAVATLNIHGTQLQIGVNLTALIIMITIPELVPIQNSI